MKKSKSLPKTLQIPIGNEAYRKAWEKFNRLSSENPGWSKGYLFSVIMEIIPDHISMEELMEIRKNG